MTPCLAGYYSAHYSLFCNTLGLDDADIETLVAEARQIVPTDSLEYITQVFIATSHFLKVPMSKTANTGVMPLAGYRIFPIQTGMSNFDYLSTALDTDEWYIADRSHLRQSFEGKLHLLAFDKQALEEMEPLIQELGLEQRLLSKAAIPVAMIEGMVEFHPQYTASLRAKARCIAR